MSESNIYKLRRYLHKLILSNADYNSILNTSKKLDKAIFYFYKNNKRKNSIK